MSNTAERNIVLDEVMDLVRNWAFAVTVASIGTTKFYTEIVIGRRDLNHLVFWSCIVISTIWFALAIFRFWIALHARYRSKWASWVFFIIACLLFGIAYSLLGIVARFADNSHVINLCERAKPRADHTIAQADECVRLDQQREEELSALEEKMKEKHHP